MILPRGLCCVCVCCVLGAEFMLYLSANISTWVDWIKLLFCVPMYRLRYHLTCTCSAFYFCFYFSVLIFLFIIIVFLCAFVCGCVQENERDRDCTLYSVHYTLCKCVIVSVASTEFPSKRLNKAKAQCDAIQLSCNITKEWVFEYI